MTEAVARMAMVLRQLIDAYDTNNLEMNSPEIGGENDIPPHPWHEEWLHHARAALDAYDAIAPDSSRWGDGRGKSCPAWDGRDDSRTDDLLK